MCCMLIYPFGTYLRWRRGTRILRSTHLPPGLSSFSTAWPAVWPPRRRGGATVLRRTHGARTDGTKGLTMTERTDLPVAVEIPGPLGQEVAAYAETELGWQVVGIDGPPAPVVVLAPDLHPDRPTIVITGSASPVDMSTMLEAGAVDVIGWPDERDRLRTAPARVRRTASTAPGPPVVRIAGVAGGVGTSTITLAIGGALAWAGNQVLVVGDDELLAMCGVPPWEGPGAVEVASLD